MARLIVKSQGQTFDITASSCKTCYEEVRRAWQLQFNKPMPNIVKATILDTHMVAHVFGFEGFIDSPDGSQVGWGLS